MLEAAPQFGLQCYIVCLSLTPINWIKWASLTTSALALSLRNIEDYVSSRLEEKEVKTKNEEYEITLKVKMKLDRGR